MSGEVSNQHHLLKGGKAERFALRIRKKTPGPLSHADPRDGYSPLQEGCGLRPSEVVWDAALTTPAPHTQKTPA